MLFRSLENQHRYILLRVNALLVAAGFIVLRDALLERRERFYASALRATAIPAGGLYLTCIAETVANSTMAVQGDHTPFPPMLSHLYDVLEFFACALTYVSTALAAAALHKAGLLGKVCVHVFVALCVVFMVLLVLHGIEYPEISGQTAPWYTQPGVIVRIPAIPWLMPGDGGDGVAAGGDWAGVERNSCGTSIADVQSAFDEVCYRCVEDIALDELVRLESGALSMGRCARSTDNQSATILSFGGASHENFLLRVPIRRRADAACRRVLQTLLRTRAAAVHRRSRRAAQRCARHVARRPGAAGRRCSLRAAHPYRTHPGRA